MIKLNLIYSGIIRKWIKIAIYVENAKSEEASWKVSWCQEHFMMVEMFRNHPTLHKANTGPYFLLYILCKGSASDELFLYLWWPYNPSHDFKAQILTLNYSYKFAMPADKQKQLKPKLFCNIRHFSHKWFSTEFSTKHYKKTGLKKILICVIFWNY